MKVREVMKKHAAFCRLDTSLAGAVEIMWKNACGFLPVIGEGGNVVGVITDRDVCIALGTMDKKASEVLVQDVMLPKNLTCPKLFTCTADDEIHCALKTMRAEKIRRLPVVGREGALEGILSIDDIALRASDTVNRYDISAKDLADTYKAICNYTGCAPLSRMAS